MMQCADVQDQIHRWEQTGLLSAQEYQALEEHLAQCSSCHARHGSLQSLLRRDALGTPAAGVKAPDLSDQIMARVNRRVAPRSPFLRLPYLLPAAAAFLFLAFSPLLLRLADPGDQLVTVRFVLEAPSAQSVAVSGNFGQWSAEGITMTRSPDGRSWETTLRLRPSLDYQYNFVIDGSHWIPDPNAAVSIDDGFGGKVSLLDL